MTCEDVRHMIQDYVDRELAPEQVAAVEKHIARCQACREELNALQRFLGLARSRNRPEEPGRDLWPGIERAIVTDARQGPAGRKKTGLQRRKAAQAEGLSGVLRPRLRRAALTRTVAVVAALAVVGLATWWYAPAPQQGWAVQALSGAPRVAARTIDTSATLHLDEWLETDSDSRARLAVGAIGTLEIEPNTRLRLMDADAGNHRVELARGRLNATIWAPPKLFFVETPSATAIDLGCVYTLDVADDGSAVLAVSSGYVELVRQERHTVVSAGMSCVSYPGIGPGTPFAHTAGPAFRAALAQLDQDIDGTEALQALLREARRADAATLWYVMARMQDEYRARVFDTLRKFVPPPAGVTRAGILDGRRAMFGQWAQQIGIYMWDRAPGM